MKQKRLSQSLLAVLMAVALLVSLIPAALAAEGGKHITILGTSDMHGNIWGYSYEDNKESANNGMARLYTYIQQVRAENPNTILIDAGDDIQGTIMTDDIYNKTPDEAHPVIAAMNYMGYDAMTLGNHEFNWGIPTMQKIVGQAEFPVLAANVKGTDGKLVTGAGWTIVEKDGVKVAVIGVVTPDVPIWDGGKEGIDGCTYEAASAAVKAAIAEIGTQADLIVVSAHMGLYAVFDEENGSDSAQKILDDKERIQWFAAKQANARDVFFIGRGLDYAISLEGSLKMKEISYIHSEAYAAGELKHGTISLIEDGTLVIGVLTQSELYEKTISNMVECKSRGAYLMGLTTYGNYNIEDTASFTVYVPKTEECFATSLAVIPLQLMGYYVSVAKGLDVDKPRNLAKSVTVE